MFKKKQLYGSFFMDGVQSDDLVFKVMTSLDILFLNNESNEKYRLFKLVQVKLIQNLIR